MEWRDVIGYETVYEVSNTGLVRSKKRLIKDAIGRKRIYEPMQLIQYFDKDGYKKVSLSSHLKTKRVSVHRLVGEAFIPNPENKPVINHKDNVKDNNNVSNLEWATISENSKHYYDLVKPNLKNHPSCSQRIGQYDKEGKLIQIYPSANEASRQTGISNTTIRKVCRGEEHYNSAGGYIWKNI